MIVVNNDVTLESLLCRAQKGEVTLLAQAKEDGTFILVENTTTQQETRETAAAEESAVQTSHEADSIMQSADDSITNAVSADAKGQLISECLFDVLNFPEKTNKKYDKFLP